MPQDFGDVPPASFSGPVFAPSNQAVLHQEVALGRQPMATSPWFAVASAAAIGGLTLVEPRHLGPGAQSLYRITTAGLTGAYTAATLPPGTTAGMPARYTDGPGGQFIPLAAVGRGSVALAAGGLTLALAEPLEALDARIVHWLTERGAGRPRWWMAGLGVAMVAAGWASDRAEARALRRALLENAGVPDEDEGHGPVDPAVLSILDVLLAPGLPGAEALRLQLESLEQQDMIPGFSTDAFLVAQPDTPRIIPRTQTWPARARFTRDGVVFEIELQIHEGRLESLSIMLADEMYGPESEVDTDAAIDELTAWPAVNELELVTEAADPLS